MMNSLFKHRFIPLILAMLTTTCYVFAQLTPACSPNYSGGSINWYITNVNINGFNHSPSYDTNDYTEHTINLEPGTTYTASLTTEGWCAVGAAVDFNNDGDFDDADEMLALPGYIGNSPAIYNFGITIPPTIPTGNYRIRFWNRLANAGDGNPANSPCGEYELGSWADYTLHVDNNDDCLPPSGSTVSNILSTSADFSWAASISTPGGYNWKVVNQGDDPGIVPGVASGTATSTTASASGLTPATHYQLFVQSDCGGSGISLWSLATNFQTPCNGMPEAGAVHSTETSVCPNTPFTLSLTGAGIAAPGISFHWQYSYTGTAPWTDIPDSSAFVNIPNQMVTTYYRAYMSCSNSGLTDTTDAFLLARNPGAECYCTPSHTYGCSSSSPSILNSVVVSGGIQDVDNSNTGCGGGYTDYSGAIGVIAAQGAELSIMTNIVNISCGVKVWVDWNQDGIFANDEIVAQSESAFTSGNFNANFTVPFSALPGETIMRVRIVQQDLNFNACNNKPKGEAEDYSFTVMGLEDCDGTPAPGLTIADQSDFCISGSTTLTLEDNYNTFSGITWQWQSSPDGGSSWNDVPGATFYSYTTPIITATTMYRCKISCNSATDQGYSTPVTLTIHGLPIITVSPQTSAFCSSAPVALTASGGVNYIWSPSMGLDATTGTTVNATPVALTTYTVTGTDIYGCVSTATANVGPIADIVLTGSVSYSGACAAGNPVTVSAMPLATPGGSMEYQFTDTLGNVLRAWSAASDFTTTLSTEGTHLFKIYARNTDCPGNISNTPAEVVAEIGFTAMVTPTDATCSGNGYGSITVSDITGPGLSGSGLTWYSNDFSSSTLNPSEAALYQDAFISNGELKLNLDAPAQRGSFGIFNPDAIDPSSLHISFKMGVTQEDGADGLSWNYGDDAEFNGYNGIPHNGATSKLAISFDSYSNSLAVNGNKRGIYLIYNGAWIEDASTPWLGTPWVPEPVTPGVLAYSNYIIWAGSYQNVVIDITKEGLLTLTMGPSNTVIFNNIQLPPEYVNADKSGWKQLFDAGTGALSEAHIIDNLSITYSNLVYYFGISEGGSGALPSVWQTSAKFDSLAPDSSYDVWVANPVDPAICNKFLGTYTISAPLHIIPNPANTSGQQTCNVDDATLAIQVNNAGVYNVQYSTDGGATETQSGVASINNGTEELVIVANLAPGAYTNIKILDPVASCNSNTLSGPIILDSLSSVDITITPAAPVSCFGTPVVLEAGGADTYIWSPAGGVVSGANGAIYTVSPDSTTTYSVTGTSATGCSTIASVTVTVHPVAATTLNETICSNEAYSFGGEDLSVAGIYSDTLTATSGCDSIVTLTLTVNPVLETALAATICSNETYSFGGATLSVAGTYSDTLTAASGCDSIVTLTLSVNPVLETVLAATICSNETYSFDGATLTTSGTYADTLTATSGCDSIVTLTLTVNPVLETALAATICSNETYSFGGATLSVAGTYSDTLTAASGCDSVVTLTLNINPVLETALAATICSNETYSFGGSTLTTSGTYSDTLTAASGCDSVVTLTLNVNPVLETALVATICSNETYSFGGATLSTSGTYSDTLTAASGCDSIITLTLNVNPVLETALAATICSNETYSFGGSTLTTSGTYSDTLTATSGCDSIITLTLNVNPVLETALAATICSNETYNFGGATLSTAGTYSDTLTAASGCDSVVTLTLTVNPVLETALAATICNNEVYSFGGNDLSVAGVYADTLTAASGCDSIITLSLTVHPTPAPTAAVASNPTTCGGNDGSITIEGLIAGTAYSVAYEKDGAPQTAQPVTADGSGNAVLTALGNGAYTNIIVTNSATSCSDTTALSAVLNDPEFTITATASDNTDCSTPDGSITITSPLVVSGATYNWSYNGINGTETASSSGEIVLNGLDAGLYTNVSVSGGVSGCSSDIIASVTVGSTPVSTDITPDDASSSQSQSGGIVDYNNADCERIVTIEATNGDLGSVTADVEVTGAVGTYNEEFYFGRVYHLTASNNIGGTVTLYFSDAEISAYNTGVGSSTPDYPVVAGDGSNIVITAFHGTPGSGSGPLDYDPATAELITPTSIIHNLNGYYEITFNVGSFSGFFGTTNGTAPLPVKLVDISAVNLGAMNRVNWSTTEESEGGRFVVERSADGKSFHSVSMMNAEGISGSRYSFVDASPFTGVNYYRIEVLNNDGSRFYSRVVSAMVSIGSFHINAYPNPARDELTVKVTGIVTGTGTLLLMDVSGRVLNHADIESNGIATFPMEHLAQGMYMLKYQDDATTQTIKVNKE